MAGEVISAKLSQLEAFGTKVVADFSALTARVRSLERAGGQPNIIEKILVNGIQLAVDGNKAVNFSVPTKTSELENDAGFQNGEDVDAKLEGKATHADITNALGSYVKKEAGKGLSANDFTTELMTKLNGIAEGAQVNKIESIKVNGTAQAIGADKSVNITVPTKTSDLTNDKKYQTDTEVATAVQTAISKTGHASYQKVSAVPTVDAAQENILYLVMNSTTKHYDIYAKIKGSSGSYAMEQLDDTTVDLTGYIQKEDGKGLSTNDYTTAEKQKLANIADGAQVNTMESVKVNGAAQAIAADKSVNISVPVIYAQADQPAGLKAGDMWFQIIE